MPKNPPTGAQEPSTDGRPLPVSSATNPVASATPATDARLLITKRQAAATLSISKRTLDRLIAGGAFPPPLKIGKASRVAPADITAYLGILQQQRQEKQQRCAIRP